MNSALWLYLVLIAACDRESRQLTVSAKSLARLLGRKPETVMSLLGHLRKAGYIRYRRRSGQLWIVISDRLDTPVEVVEEPEEDSPSALLAREIAAGLGDTGNLARYEELAETHPESLVRRAYRDALAMPRERIRRSRGALFTFLLRKYAKDQENPAA